MKSGFVRRPKQPASLPLVRNAPAGFPPAVQTQRLEPVHTLAAIANQTATAGACLGGLGGSFDEKEDGPRRDLRGPCRPGAASGGRGRNRGRSRRHGRRKGDRAGHGLGCRRDRPGLPDAGRVHVPRDRLLTAEERRHGGRQDPRQPRDRDDRLVGDRLRGRRRRRQRLLRHQRLLLPLRPDDRPGRRSVQRGRLRRDADALRACLLRGLAGDRLGHDPGADQVRRLRDLRRRLRRGHLPADRARGLGRRPALRHRRQAGDGLRRLLGGPPHRCGRGACGAAAARRPQGQVRRRSANRGRSPVTRCRSSASA